MSVAAEKITVDRRIIEAIIRAVYRYDSFILKYGWVASELKDIAESEDEYRELDEKAYELIANGEIKNVSMIYFHPDNADDSVVVAAPCALSNDLMQMLEELADLYDYSGYEDPTAYKYGMVVERDRPSLDIVMHNLVRAHCIMTYRDDNARAIYDAFNAVYKLEKSFQKITEDVEP